MPCFFITASAPTQIYPLSLHDALPISPRTRRRRVPRSHPTGAARRSDSWAQVTPCLGPMNRIGADRKSTRLNSSHEWISYAVFCLKKKKNKNPNRDGDNM